MVVGGYEVDDGLVAVPKVTQFECSGDCFSCSRRDVAKESNGNYVNLSVF